MLWKGVVMYMDILKTVCTIGAVTIFYFCTIPLVVAGVVWCVQICLRALKSNFAPKRNVFLLADIAMPFVITSAWIMIGMLLSSIFDQRKSLSNIAELSSLCLFVAGVVDGQDKLIVALGQIC